MNSSFINYIMGEIGVLLDDELEFHVGEKLKEALQDRYISYWHVDDIEAVLRDQFPDRQDLVNNKVFKRNVLALIPRRFNASYGVTWIFLEQLIGEEIAKGGW